MTEFRPSKFQILPLVIKNLLIINVLFFLAQNTIGKQGWFDMDNLFALHTWQSSLFKPWQFITHMFMHGSFEHILGNMFALWMFGSTLENVWGPKRFLTFYLSCGLGAAFCHMIVLYIGNEALITKYNALDLNSYEQIRTFIVENAKNINGSIPISPEGASMVLNANLNEATLGASGAVFGCLAAFGYLFPNTSIYLYFLFPIKAKWFVILYAAAEFFMAVRNSAGDEVAHVAHLGGALVGIILVYFWNKNNRKNFY
jgi:membrane associated rhomboid family serine protease